MNKFMTILTVMAMSPTVFAGSYDFKCNAVGLDKDGFRIQADFDRSEARINSNNSLGIQDPNVNLDLDMGSSTQTYGEGKNAVSLKIKSVKVLQNHEGSIGPRDHVSTTAIVKVQMQSRNQTIALDGICSEETVTTCGGSCQ